MARAAAAASLWLVLVVAQCRAPAQARLAMFQTFGDHAVLDNTHPKVHGVTTDTTAPVTLVEAGGVSATYWATPDASGTFVVSLKARAPSATPSTLTVTAGDGGAVAHGVLFGTVIFCGGQSNMVHPVSYDYNATAQIAAAVYPNVRLFQTGRQVTPTPKVLLACNDTGTIPGLTPPCGPQRNAWFPLSPATVPRFSAACYFTAQELLRQHLGPGAVVGLIESDWGGTPQEDWMPVSAYNAYDPATGTCVQPHTTTTATTTAAAQQQRRRHGLGGSNWPKGVCDQPSTCLFNGMIHPFTLSTAPSFFLWYQGEADSPYPGPEYGCRLNAMIGAWRAAFAPNTGDPTLPFFVTQLSAYWTPAISLAFAHIRLFQERASLEVPRVGLAVTHDIGDVAGGVHPHNKTEVGRRLALSVLAIRYGVPAADLPWPNPRALAPQRAGSAVTVPFANATRLAWGPTHNCSTCCDARGMSVELSNSTTAPSGGGGATAGHTILVPATVVGGNELSFRIPAGASGLHLLRFAWTNFPQCVLFNEVGLPSGPFFFDLGV